MSVSDIRNKQMEFSLSSGSSANDAELHSCNYAQFVNLNTQIVAPLARSSTVCCGLSLEIEIEFSLKSKILISKQGNNFQKYQLSFMHLLFHSLRNKKKTK